MTCLQSFRRASSLVAIAEPLPTDPNSVELEMLADAAEGSPLKRTAQQGVTDMEARIALLNEQKVKTLDRLNQTRSGTVRAELNSHLTLLNDDLRQANDRLREYKTQLEGTN